MNGMEVIKIGVLKWVDENTDDFLGSDPREIAAATGWHVDSVQAALEMLVSDGVVEKRKETAPMIDGEYTYHRVPFGVRAFNAGKAAGRVHFDTGAMLTTPSWVYEQGVTAEYNKGIDCGEADARYDILNAHD